MDRKKLAVKSSFIGLMCKLLATLLSFFCRKVFLTYLGADLLGVNGTLTQVLETLSLTELGVQTAIIFQLYKPLADDDHESITHIMMVLKRVYSIIGVAVLGIGISIVPLLPKLITKVDVDFIEVYIVYGVMLIGTALSYFLSYNRALIQADQKVYINNLIDSVLLIISTILRLLALALIRSYIMYALIGVVKTVVGNYLSMLYYKKNYPYIKNDKQIDKRLLKIIFINTKDVFVGRIAGYVYSSTDNLVISALVGTRWVGLVGNYSTIINAIKMVIFGLTGPIQPMLGNFAVTNSKDQTERTMKNYGFIRFTMAVFLLVPTVCLSDMFVFIFYGSQYVQSPAIIALLSIDLFIVCMQGAAGELIDALGFFKQERNMYIVYAILNFGLSCLGAILWGVIPVFIATVFSQIVGWIWRSIIVYKHYFYSRSGLISYWKDQAVMIVFFTVAVLLSKCIVALVELPSNFLGFICYGVILEAFCMCLFFVSFRKRTEFKYLRELVGRVIPKRG